MFALDEIDKILESLVSKKGRESRVLRVNLPDIERIEVDKLRPLIRENKKDYHTLDIVEQNRDLVSPFKLNLFAKHDDILSTDRMFATQMNDLLSPILANVPQRHYPTAKLIIYDDLSYEALTKLQRVISLGSGSSNSADLKNFLYKKPFNITAIFSIKYLSELLDQSPNPKLVNRLDRSNGKSTKQLNYFSIKREFPYLKLTDTIIILYNKQLYESQDRHPQTGEPRMTLSFLQQFSRSVQFVELREIIKNMGAVHHIYDNVLTFAPRAEISNFLRPSFEQLTHLAEQLVRITNNLRLRLDLISYRMADPYGSTKVFSQLVTSILKTSTNKKLCESYRPARLLVIDRFVDLQSFLFHADLYGPYVEQEELSQNKSTKLSTSQWLTSSDELDDKLQLCQLNEALNIVIQHAASLKVADTGTLNFRIPTTTVMSVSQSILHHLVMIKELYKSLDGGYLLLLRLESTVATVTDQVRSLKEPLSSTKQEELALRVERVYNAFKKLVKSRSISLESTERLACILVDVMNVFFYIASNDETLSKKASSVMSKVNSSLVGKFRKILSDMIDHDDKKRDTKIDLVHERFTRFNKVSKDTCSSRSALKLETIVETFLNNKLSNQFYPLLSIREDSSKVDFSVLVILGPLTPSEIGRIKVLEKGLHTGKILVVCVDIWRPSDFLQNL